MEKIDKDLEIIENYLENRLPPSDRSEMEKRLLKDTAFASLLNKTEGTLKAIRTSAEASTMSLLNGIYDSEKKGGFSFEIDSSNRESGKIIKLKSRRWLAIAASISLLIFASIWVIQSNGNNADYFAQYYETPSFDLQRGGDAAATYTQAATLYNAQNYGAALSSLRQLESSTQNNTDVRILMGICMLETGQTNEALLLFSELIAGAEQLDQVLWLKAMTALKIDDKEQASQSLQQLLESNIRVTNKRKEQAQELLEKLN